MSMRGGRPFRMSGSCREALSDVREALSDVRECLEGSPRTFGGPSGCPGVVEKLSRMSL